MGKFGSKDFFPVKFSQNENHIHTVFFELQFTNELTSAEQFKTQF